jgi:hypothetical protein
LEAEADLSETALPVAVREIFSKGLLRRLSYGEHSAFAIKRVSQAFGANNFNAFVAPALTRALGEDTHLDTVASAARRAEISQDDDDIVTPAAAVAAAEGSACKGGWSLTPMRRRKKFTHSEDVRETSASTRRDFSRESGAVAALAATLPLFDRATLLALLFPAFPGTARSFAPDSARAGAVPGALRRRGGARRRRREEARAGRRVQTRASKTQAPVRRRVEQSVGGFFFGVRRIKRRGGGAPGANFSVRHLPRARREDFVPRAAGFRAGRVCARGSFRGAIRRLDRGAFATGFDSDRGRGFFRFPSDAHRDLL